MFLFFFFFFLTLTNNTSFWNKSFAPKGQKLLLLLSEDSACLLSASTLPPSSQALTSINITSIEEISTAAKFSLIFFQILLLIYILPIALCCHCLMLELSLFLNSLFHMKLLFFLGFIISSMRNFAKQVADMKYI